MALKSISKKNIKKQLSASDVETLPEAFVAAAAQISAKGTFTHAGIAVGSDAGKHLFHFNSKSTRKVELEYCRMYYQLEFQTIPPYLAEAFFVHCSEALDSASPEYGYFYNGTYFKEGKLINPNEGSPYRMTCVGFCLGLLNGWNVIVDAEAFIAHEDWDSSNSLTDIEKTVELKELKALYPYLEEEELSKDIKRIKPSQYLASAYVNEFPVRKTSVDPIASVLEEIATEIVKQEDEDA